MTPARLAVIALVSCSYGVILLSIAGHGPPLWFVVGLLAAQAIVVHLGIFFVNFGVFLDVVSEIEPGRRAVALTFDDGPHPVHTPRVLDMLDAVGAKATFFVIGAKADAHPEVIAEIARRGHEVALHSYEHDHLLFMRPEPSIVRDLVKTQDAIERACGARSKLFRPPVGFSSPRTRVAVKELGLVVVGWSARAFDGAGRPSVERILERLSASVRDGAIVLLHDAPERGDNAPTSLEALPALLAMISERGLSTVTVSSLIGSAQAEPVVARV
ncbi:MAG: polysaccharide deacetylase family protein [Polyangiaceae bacterium]|nr:polysaccharide deacetylase family protein [Polyangiaceae bacterium]